MSDDDAEIERLKADAFAALKSLVAILKSEASIDEKRAALIDAHSRETRCSDCVDRKCSESFHEDPHSARTSSMADTALNLLSHLLKFFAVVRDHRIPLGFTAEAFEPNPASFSNMQRLVSVYHSKPAEKLRASFASEKLPTHGFDNPFPHPVEKGASVPRWFPIVGSIFGLITLLFLMGLVIAEVLGMPIPVNARFLVVGVLALGAALSGSFLGGTAAAEGKIPVPFVKSHPIAFTASGGVAILVIVLLIGYYTYIRPGSGPSPVERFPQTGRIDLDRPTDLDFDSVVIPKDAVIQTNGYDFLMRVKGDLSVENEAVIRAFDYEYVAENPPLPEAGPEGTPGTNQTGSASGTGAEGARGGHGQPGQRGGIGRSGKSAGRIKLVVDGRATGKLSVLNSGTDGQPGGNGGKGGRGGHGEGGGPGSGSSLSYPAGRHMGSGGRGGDGGKGGEAGRGGDGGDGGSVIIHIGRNKGLTLHQSVVSGGKAGLSGRPGQGGLAGEPGGGYGNGGPGTPGSEGSAVAGLPKDGKAGKIDLRGVDLPIPTAAAP